MNTHFELSAIIVEQGKILDFIDGKTQRLETPEEYVRQEIAKSLVREYRYAKTDVEVEFTLRIGTKKPRADLVILSPDSEHKQENAYIIVECKAPTVKAADKKEGVGQLQSYMAACPNVHYGMWTNGIERFCYRRLIKGGVVKVEEVPDMPEFGREGEEAERPRFDQLKPPHPMLSYSPFAVVTITSQVIRASRSHRRFGNCSSLSFARFTMSGITMKWSSTPQQMSEMA